MTKVRQPRVLDESMREVRRLAPQTLSCTVTQLHETLPTAMVTVDEADELTGRPFVEVYGIRGSMGIFRVDAVGATYGESREYRLTHALSTLQDDVDVLLGKPAKGFFNKETMEIEQLLKTTGREGRFNLIKRVSLFLFALGAVIALLLNNPFMIPILGAGFAFTPVWYLR